MNAMKLRELRRASALPMARLAQDMGEGTATLSARERGERTFYASDISRYLDRLHHARESRDRRCLLSIDSKEERLAEGRLVTGTTLRRLRKLAHVSIQELCEGLLGDGVRWHAEAIRTQELAREPWPSDIARVYLSALRRCVEERRRAARILEAAVREQVQGRTLTPD